VPEPLLKVQGLKKYFPVTDGMVFWRPSAWVKAVDGIDFDIYPGETLGVIGESGCGKTTTAKLLLLQEDPTEGSISFDGEDVTGLKGTELKNYRGSVQVVFQDPFSSLSPRMRIRDIIAEPLEIHTDLSRKAIYDRVGEVMQLVGLQPDMSPLFPHEFSGGQRQRIGIARSLALQPRLVVCDEPVSALDVSVQAQVLNLLDELKHRLGLTYLFIAHDLSVVDHVCDRVMVMYLGKIVEHAGADAIYRTPKHPYTEALLGAIPTGDPRSRRSRVVLGGAVPDARNVPEGCRFHPRCPYVQERCRREEPKLREVAPGHASACLFAEELRLKGFAEPCATG
jgi:oligopeptide/dipeptide ABC transporter ATP-binding protein